MIRPCIFCDYIDATFIGKFEGARLSVASLAKSINNSISRIDDERSFSAI